MPEIEINGKRVNVAIGTTVAAALLNAGCGGFRHSASGQSRGPLCGMGICYECRVTIDSQQHARSCQILCREGMVIETT